MKINKIIKLIPSKENHLAKLDKTITSKGGVYFLYDEELNLIYIGKSQSIRGRILAHVWLPKCQKNSSLSCRNRIKTSKDS